ncbi:MAG: FhaA domain-containing protein [Acidimicrobiales bacterium]
MRPVAGGRPRPVEEMQYPVVLRNFEDRLERMVEGMFARAFRSGLQPVELGRRLVKEMDLSRTLDVRGRALAPNRFVIRVSAEDLERFGQVRQSLIDELAATVREHAREEQLSFLGRVSVELDVDPNLRVGLFRVHPSYDERIAPDSESAWFEEPSGQQHRIAAPLAAVGRLSDSDIVINDQNVSRRHAEIHVVGDDYELVDLGSTNGSKVNGERIQRRTLADGDQVTFGAITLRFRRR